MRGLREWLRESHERVIAVDHHPWPGRPGKRRQLLALIEQPPAGEQHLADEDEVMATAARGFEEAVGEGIERLGGDAGDAGLSLLVPAGELPPGTVEFAVAGQHPQRSAAWPRRTRRTGGRGNHGCWGENDGVGSAGTPSSAATWPCASGQTSPITLSHLRSASAAASCQPFKLAVEAGVGPQMMAVRGQVQPLRRGAERLRENKA